MRVLGLAGRHAATPKKSFFNRDIQKENVSGIASLLLLVISAGMCKKSVQNGKR